LAAVREAAKLSGDYRAAEDASRLNRQALSPLVEEWSRKLRAMVKAEGYPDMPLDPQTEAGEDSVSEGKDASVPLDGSTSGVDGQNAATGHGSAPTGTDGQGTEGEGG